MSKGEIIVETQELKDYNYITALNNDLNLFNNLTKTDQYQSHDAEYDNGIIEIKERCTTDRKNPKNGESWCYAKEIFVEEHKLREFAKYKERYPDVEKAKLMAFLLLQPQNKVQKQSSSNSKRPSFFKRLMEVLRSEEE